MIFGTSEEKRTTEVQVAIEVVDTIAGKEVDQMETIQMKEDEVSAIIPETILWNIETEEIQTDSETEANLENETKAAIGEAKQNTLTNVR